MTNGKIAVFLLTITSLGSGFDLWRSKSRAFSCSSRISFIRAIVFSDFSGLAHVNWLCDASNRRSWCKNKKSKQSNSI